MKLSQDAILLRIYLGETAHHEGRPLYEKIVRKARELKIAGATVLRGIMGFGAKSHLHTAKLLRLSEDLPVIIEIVDSEENLEKLMPFLDEIVEEGLITKEKVNVIKYRSTESK